MDALGRAGGVDFGVNVSGCWGSLAPQLFYPAGVAQL